MVQTQPSIYRHLLDVINSSRAQPQTLFNPSSLCQPTKTLLMTNQIHRGTGENRLGFQTLCIKGFMRLNSLKEGTPNGYDADEREREREDSRDLFTAFNTKTCITFWINFFFFFLNTFLYHFYFSTICVDFSVR